MRDVTDHYALHYTMSILRAYYDICAATSRSRFRAQFLARGAGEDA